MADIVDLKDMEEGKSNSIEPDEELIIDEPQQHITGRVDQFLDNLKSWFYKTCSVSNMIYDKILVEAKDPATCIAILMHLIRTARRQKTNSVFAKDIYLKNGLKLGDKKIKNGKSELKRLGIIEYVYRRDPKGKVTGVYIKILYLPAIKGFRSSGSISTPEENHTSGLEGQMLKGINKLLKENKGNEEIEEKDNNQSFDLPNLQDCKSNSSPAQEPAPDCVDDFKP